MAFVLWVIGHVLGRPNKDRMPKGLAAQLSPDDVSSADEFETDESLASRLNSIGDDDSQAKCLQPSTTTRNVSESCRAPGITHDTFGPVITPGEHLAPPQETSIETAWPASQTNISNPRSGPSAHVQSRYQDATKLQLDQDVSDEPQQALTTDTLPSDESSTGEGEITDSLRDMLNLEYEVIRMTLEDPPQSKRDLPSLNICSCTGCQTASRLLLKWKKDLSLLRSEIAGWVKTYTLFKIEFAELSKKVACSEQQLQDANLRHASDKLAWKKQMQDADDELRQMRVYKTGRKTYYTTQLTMLKAATAEVDQKNEELASARSDVVRLEGEILTLEKSKAPLEVALEEAIEGLRLAKEHGEEEHKALEALTAEQQELQREYIDLATRYKQELNQADQIRQDLADARRVKVTQSEREASELPTLKAKIERLTTIVGESSALKRSNVVLKQEAADARQLRVENQRLHKDLKAKSNLKVENDSLKRKMSSAATSSLKQELRQVKAKLAEYDLQTSGKQVGEKNSGADDDSAEAMPTLTPRSKKAFEDEAMRVLRLIRASHADVLNAVDQFEDRGGNGWGAVDQARGVFERMTKRIDVKIEDVFSLRKEQRPAEVMNEAGFPEIGAWHGR